MAYPSPAERSSLLSGPKRNKRLPASDFSDALRPDRVSPRRRLWFWFIMVLTSFIFVAGLALSLASPLQRRQGSGPVIGSNFQDPSVVQLADGSYVAYAGVNGNPGPSNVLVATSPDFASWTIRTGFDGMFQSIWITASRFLSCFDMKLIIEQRYPIFHHGQLHHRMFGLLM